MGDVYNPLCLLPVLSPSGSTADQGNSCWHAHTQHRILSCTKSPKISFTNQNVCIPPLLPPHGPGNCKHCPASSPIHHTDTELWALKSSPSSVADKAAASSNKHNLLSCTRAEKVEFGVFRSLTKQSQRAPGERRRKSLPGRELRA